MISQLTLDLTHMHEVIQHVEAQAPLEACGLLAGKNSQVTKVILVRNQAQSAVRFVMDPYEQLEAFEWIDSHDLDLLGIFHSHPAGPETPSATDIVEAAYEVVHIICSRPHGQWQVRGFWIDHGQVHEIALLITGR
jgi:proteasome lid subunit RPN8/RPN11